MSYSEMPALTSNQGFTLGKGIKVTGQITGGENLQFDGELEGSIELSGHLVVGPNAKMKANVHAKQVVIHGRVDGNVTALELVDIRNTGIVYGELLTTRLNIEDGALIKGTVNIRREAGVSGGSSSHGAEAEKAAISGHVGSQTPMSIPVEVKPNV